MIENGHQRGKENDGRQYLESKYKTQVRRIRQRSENEGGAFHGETDDAYKNTAQAFKEFSPARNQYDQDGEKQLQADSGCDQFEVHFFAVR